MLSWNRLLSLFALLVGFLSTHSPAAAHEPTMDYPTIKCLGMLWPIDDNDQKAKVSVEYQKAGATTWKRGLDLFRTEAAALPKTMKVPAGATLFAGSIVDLEEDTAYKIKLTLTGVGDKVEKILEGRTRPEPKPAKGDRVLHVVPGNGGGAGTMDDPFKGLQEAQTKAQAGDVFLVHKGVYEGTFKVERQGTRDNPITWRGAGDGDAILDGGGKERAVDASGAKFVRFENLTLRNAVFLAVLHRSEGCVVAHCRINANEKVAYALTAGQNAKELYIANNVFEGPTKWPRANYPGPKNKAPWGTDVTDIRAIVVSGVGHVICHNSLNNFGDGIDTAKGAPDCACIDIYNNEISNMVDDGIELDESHRNVRCFDNRITNCHVGISAQPVLGGPVYVFRNCIYNIEYTPFKLHNSPSGLLAFHNTSVKSGMPMTLYAKPPVRNCVFRNNLFVGGEATYAWEFSPQMKNCDFDYDGFAGGPFKQIMKWNNVRYPTLEELRSNGPVEKHCKLVSLTTCFASKVETPRDLKTSYPIAVNDLRLADNSEAIGAGTILPNFNDGFRGKAPDLGALQHGAASPHYGPRK